MSDCKPPVHDFQESLDFSHSMASHPVWGEIYRSLFPDLLHAQDMRHDGEHQRRGVDRLLILRNQKTVTVDEKARRKAYRTLDGDYDIALEYDTNGGKPGWVCNPEMTCDYIAYLVAPLGVGCLLPMPQLRLAWAVHGEEWKRKFKRVRAPNRDYTTYSVAVPRRALFSAIGAALRFSFDPITGGAP